MQLLTAPKFLSMPAVGLDISDDSVRFIELSTEKDGLVVSRFATRNFPLGVIAEGHIRDKKKLQDTIVALAHEHKLSFVNVSLPEEQAYLANMRIPRANAGQLRDTIELQLEEYVPINGQEAIFDFTIVADTKKKEYIEAVVAVLPRTVVEEYLEVFRGTGVTPKAFEFESQAMARSIIKKDDNGTFMVIDIGKMVTDIFVVANSIVQFSASIDIGGHYLTTAIEKALSITYEEAEAQKTKNGLIAGMKDRRLYEAMLPVVTDLRTRILRHYSYWQTHHGEKAGGAIECIYLTGGTSNLRGLSEYLATGLDVRVATANPWVNVRSFEEYIPPLSVHEAQGYAAAIGLALRDSFMTYD